MAKGYRRLDRDQGFLLPPDMREWLPADDPVWLVMELIEGLDTSAFHLGRRTGGAGRAGYDPDMVLTLLVWAWLQGVHSSRQIERLCGRDVSFRVICAGDVPDHVTIARFRQGFGAGVQQLFAEVVLLARRLGLVQLGVVALDGTKIAAPASSGQNRTDEGLRNAAQAEQERQAERARARGWAREAAARHAEQDAEEDARFGAGHGDVRRGDPGGAERGQDRSGRAEPGRAGQGQGGQAGHDQAGHDQAAGTGQGEAGEAGHDQADRDQGDQAGHDQAGTGQGEAGQAGEADCQADRDRDGQDAAEDVWFAADQGDVPCGDAAGSAQPGPGGAGSGSGASRGGWGGGSRLERIAAALADVEREVQQRQAEEQALVQARLDRQAAKGGGPVDGRPPAGTEVGLAEQALARARAEVAQRHQRWLEGGSRGRHPCPDGVESDRRVRKALARLARAHTIVAARQARQAARPPDRGPVRNISDPQSRLQPTAKGGWVQGYNAQAVTSRDGIIVAAQVGNNPADVGTFAPMLAAAQAMASRLGGDPIGLIVADAGYLSIDNLTMPGPDRLIAVGNRRSMEAAAQTADPATDAGKSDPAIQAMRSRLATPEGISAYRQRGPIAETVFGHGKHNLRFRRFTGTGLDRANAEWTFHATVHNLSKIIKNGGLQPGWSTS